MSHAPLGKFQPQPAGLKLLILTSLALGVLIFQPPSLRAQDPKAAPPPREVRYFDVREKMTTLQLAEKGARVVRTENQIRTVDGFDATVIRVTQVPGETRQIRVQGLVPGVTSMILVDEIGETFQIEILVGGDTKHFEALIKDLYPDSSVRAVKVKDSIVVDGWVTQSDQVSVIMDIAARMYTEPLNALKVSGDQQVMLHVKIMEVQRGKIRQLGFNFLDIHNGAYGSSHIGGLTPLSTATVPLGGPPGLGVAPTAATATFGIVEGDSVFQGFLEALKTESLLKVLAEPNLVAINGRPASFLNGGEFPILVPQGFGTVSVQFKPFGVRLEFVANNVGNGRVRLDVTPEVSDRDLSNVVTVNGITVPALTVRRANTQVEMNVGETLVIAGLISNRVQAKMNKMPLLGELPYIGAAFRRISYDEAETELLITVTPDLAGPNADGYIPPGPGSGTVTPTDRELFGSGYIETLRFGPDPECEGCLPSMGGAFDPNCPPGFPSQPDPDGSLPPSVPSDNYFGSPNGQPAPAGPPVQLSSPPKGAPAAPQPAPQTTYRGTSRNRQTASRTTTVTPPGGTSKSAPILKSPERKTAAGTPPRMIQPVSGTAPAPTKPRTGTQRPGLITP